MSDITCVTMNFELISVGQIGLKNYGLIYGLTPDFTTCKNDSLNVIKTTLCSDDEYKNRIMCKCINYTNNLSSYKIEQECQEKNLGDSICGTLVTNSLCTDPYCVTMISPAPLRSDYIDEQFNFDNNDSICANNTSCQTILNIDGYDPDDFSQNICQTSETVDPVKDTLLDLYKLFGCGITFLLLVLFFLYWRNS